jgi:hypothetical protein
VHFNLLTLLLLSKILFIASRKFVDWQNKIHMPTEHPVECNWLESETTGKEFIGRILQKGNKSYMSRCLKYAAVLSVLKP